MVNRESVNRESLPRAASSPLQSAYNIPAVLLNSLVSVVFADFCNLLLLVGWRPASGTLICRSFFSYDQDSYQALFLSA